ncbi:TonB-dependent receptor [Sphingobacterium sp. UT-1RO-CII-1]|uniref:SusC/RagA family TonB-linked outer membrane protein n=1 Tax=Sphingobacterium sp. UT-1RO-CII-1 TaxID=2995225 RepID=UPI00227B3EDE|nr:TonB-dependent receptor [Sphingobacterium sp. UT-1RO-CII-1]MCY4780748.1 TonB-dependent receptor [Sphingobacterium sp. UT-1RO-CII-1]
MKKIIPVFLLAGACFASNVLASPFEGAKLEFLSLQENETLSGRVIDASGNAISHATVSVKGTTKITTTDADGMFSLKHDLQAGVVLTISCVGYTTLDFKVNESRNIVVTMSDNNDLEEVVVVGYGTQKKVNLTGAVAQIDSKILEDRPVSNATQALQGAVPNLNINFTNGRPGGGGKVNIRGFASINSANAAPLVLIDGVPGNINTINPKDIESISVLKDASAAAIYGARGAFGVMLVTTKKGKEGQMTINYSNNFGSAGLTVNTDFMTSGYDAARLNDEAFIRATGNSYTGYTEEDYAELLKRKNDPSLPWVTVQNRNGKDQYVYYGNTDWWNTFYRKRQNSMEHALTFSGGSEKIDYYVSGRLYEKGGLMKVNQDKFNSYNLRSRLNAKVTDWLKISNNTQLNYQNYTYPGWNSSSDANNNFISTTVHALPSYVAQNPDGTATYRTELNNYNIGDGIMADLLHGKSKGGEKEYEFINLLEGVVSITQDLTVTGNYTFTYNPINTFNRRTMAPWSIFPGEISYLGNDQYTENMVTNRRHSLNLFANYNKSVGDHNFGATAGYNQELNVYGRIGGRHNNLLSEDLNDFALGTGQMELYGGARTWALQGFFGRVNYNFKDKYLVEVNGRYDGTSKFPKNKRYGFFPSFSAGWRLMEESFMEPIKAHVNEAKFRVSYGALGNAQEAAEYGYIPLLNTGNSNYITNGTKTQYLKVPTPISPDLTWERTNTLNFGLDMEFASRRLTTSFDYFIRETLDMLIPGKTLPAVFGAASPKTNAGDLKNKGWELSMAWRDQFTVAGKPMTYNVGLGLSDSKAEITRFDNKEQLLSNYYVGQTLGEIWGYKTDGFFNSDEEAAGWKINQDYVDKQRLAAPGDWSRLQAGDLKFVDVDGDGIVDAGKNTLNDPGDQIIIGNNRARYTFGINLGASWQGIDVSAFFQGIGRQHWWPGANADKFWGPYSRPYYSFVPKDFEADVWTPENKDAYFPLMRGYIALNDRGSLNVKSDRYLQDLAYIRLKNLTVGYTLPQRILKPIKLANARIFASGENLWTATKLKSDYIDPEQAAQEANGRAYPYSKTISFGIDLTF